MDPCDGVTSRARLCQRRARYSYLDSDGNTLARYCTQHHNGAGPTRLLRPYPWRVARVFDRKTNRYLEV